MREPHIPDMAAVEALGPELRFYAAVGVLVSIDAAIERLLFHVFEKASGLGREMAATLFYRGLSGQTRRDLADGAMRIRLGETPGKYEWIQLAGRIRGTEGANVRNLVAHNPSEPMFEFDWDSDEAIALGLAGTPPIGDLLGLPVGLRREHIVKQDEIEASVRRRPESLADFQAVRSACEERMGVMRDLRNFLDREL